MGIMGSIRFCDSLSHWVQPPDAENRTSGGVGALTGATSRQGHPIVTEAELPPLLLLPGCFAIKTMQGELAVTIRFCI